LNTSFDILKDKYHLFFVSWDSYSFFRGWNRKIDIIF
jgi:hypothetical protein